MKSIFTILAILCVFHSKALLSQNTPKQTSKAKTKMNDSKSKRLDNWEMKTYYMVFLKKGPKRDQDSITAAKIQDGHLNHLDKLYRTGKMDICGPMLDDGDILGICIYNAGSIEEVKALAEADPAVASGRLIVEIHPFMAAKDCRLR